MADFDSLPVSDLLIDVENPRLVQTNVPQREAIRAIASDQQAKLYTLADDILNWRLNPMDPLLVMPQQGSTTRYIVLEGNRRLAALRVLENPDLIDGAVPANLLRRFKALSERYQEAPIENVRCSIVSSRAEANHWIELRHTGENEGAGTVRWGGEETARFRQRSRNESEPHLQVLDFLEERGELHRGERNRIPVTSLRRLLGTPYVRTKLGIDLRDGEVVTRYPNTDVAKALGRVVHDLSSGKVKTQHIYTTDDRIRYVDSLPDSILPDLSHPHREFRTLGSKSPKAVSSPKPKQPTTQPPRSRLVPRDLSLTISEPRLAEILRELRTLDLDDYKNAVAVLFRVFLELSLDSYIARHSLTVPERLNVKLTAVAEDLKKHGKLSPQQLKPIKRAAQADSFFAPTITTMHQYVHNQYFFPAPSDLRATWDSLQPFIVAVWGN